MIESPKLQLEGRSGCKIELIKLDSSYVVRKTSSSNLYNNRLESQVEMQRQFNFKHNYNAFFSPKVINSGFNEFGLFYFEMEYINGLKFSDYFSSINSIQVREISNIFFNYFEKNINESVNIPPPTKKIYDKIIDVKAKSLSNNFVQSELVESVANFLIKNIPTSQIPLGYCHGDFTFSNILIINENKLSLLDFLDSFIESPIIDIVKFRQDTKYYWSLVIDNDLELHKKVRVIQVLNQIDQLLNDFLNLKFQNYLEWITFLEVLNLFRILPYVENNEDYMFLKKNLSIEIKI